MVYYSITKLRTGLVSILINYQIFNTYKKGVTCLAENSSIACRRFFKTFCYCRNKCTNFIANN